MTTTATPDLSLSPATAEGTSNYTSAAVGRSRGWRDLRSLLNALRSERIKLVTVRTGRALFLMTIIINFAAALATAKLVTDEVLTVSKVFVFPAIFTAVFVSISGILMFTSEAQHGTLAVTIAARPTRWVIAGAKALMSVTVGGVFGLVGMAAAAGGAALGGLALGSVSAMAATAGWALLYTGAAAIFGLGVGMIARHSGGAISGLLVWWFVAENLIRSFVAPTIGRFLPFDAGYRTLGVGSNFDTPEILAAALRRPEYALIFGSYAILTLALGVVLLNRRDVN
ncbi:MAG: hypothetical protein WBA45_15190 [Microthrixaceae bacterium]